MKNPEELHYYCTFDANTGEKLGGYILEFQKVPPEAISVSYNDFKLYNSSNYWRYDWDEKKPVYVDRIMTMTFEELKARAKEIINQNTEKAITAGFTAYIQGQYVKFDSDLEAQVTYSNNFNDSVANPEGTWQARGYVNGAGEKSILTLNATDMATIQTACTTFVNAAKKKGWEEQAYVDNGSLLLDDLRSFVRKLEKEARN